MIGNFNLEKTRSGNIIGEFTNNLTNQIFTESADLIDGNLLEFNGTYLDTWQEKNIPYLSKLVIVTIENTSNLKYSLKWFNDKNELIFLGQGFIYNDLLTGYYESA